MNIEHGSCSSHFTTDFEEEMSTISVHSFKENKALEIDTENYMQHRLQSSKLRLKKGTLPHKFACQKTKSPAPVAYAERAAKRQRKKTVQEILTEPSTSAVCVKKESKNLNPIKGLDVTFLKELLKGAEDYIRGLDVLLVQEENEMKAIVSCEQGLTASNQHNHLKQTLPGICSIKEEVISDDEFLDCNKCNLQCKGPCYHPEQVSPLSDTKAPQSDPDRAVMPHFLSLGSIPTAGLGVWSEITLPPGLLFGPFEGKILHQEEDPKSGYAWQVRKGQNMQCFVDGKDRSASNWLRFVKYATREEQQNMVAFRCKNRIFYKTSKHILPHTEILVWYGEEYANEMGFGFPQNMALPPAEKQIEYTLPCSTIQHSYSHIQKPYQCQLKVNFFAQSGERPHRCQHCQMSFRTKGNLNQHLHTHSGERPHKCQHCQKVFTRETSLKHHLMIHSGERPHECHHCHKAFIQKASLKHHLLIHSG